MKRVTAFFLFIVFVISIFSGCGLPFVLNTGKTTEPRETLSDRDEEAVSLVEDLIIESDSISDALLVLIDDQIEASEKMVREYTEATLSGLPYDGTAYNDQIETVRTTVEALSEDVKGFQQELSDIKKPKAKEAVMVYDAAEVYFNRLQDCLADLLAVVTLYIEQTEAVMPLYNYDVALYGDDVGWMVSEFYGAIDDTINNLKAIESCPPYMEESYQIYIEKSSVYLKMAEEWYYGVMLNDPLRVMSGNQLLMRQTIDVSRYEGELFALFDLQYIKVGERLEGSILTLNNEIQDNCTKLIMAKKELPEIAFSYLDKDPQVNVDFSCADAIYPSLYASMNSIINLTATTDQGEVDLLVTAKIPGFTQEYRQTVTVNEQVTKLLIKPALSTEVLDLESARDAQLHLSVRDVDTDKSIVEETRTIQLMSVYDFMLTDDEFGVTSRDNVLAWLTPESESILNLRRNAITWAENYTDGLINSLVGYQDYGVFDDPALNTVMQIVAIQGAISDMGVRYNMGPFSLSEGVNQRVLLPDRVLSSGSGICIETAILFATAIQSTDMHAMIVFIPGHAQVAVETGYETGQYFLVETTLLPFYGSEDEINALVTEMTSDEWQMYLADPYGDGSGEAYVVDCDLVHTLGIKAIGYK
ncbi:MAG: hypothetical protein JW780_07140 [Clostridiales bacterium]|nr:hypothetical protein [Clostridiales bacterium]